MMAAPDYFAIAASGIRAHEALRRAARTPCDCAAYPHPHRKGGGACQGADAFVADGNPIPWWERAADEAGVPANGPINF